MIDITLRSDLVNALLHYLSTKPSGETGDLYSTIKALSERQIKEHEDKQAQEKMEAEIKARMEVKQEVMD